MFVYASQRLLLDRNVKFIETVITVSRILGKHYLGNKLYHSIITMFKHNFLLYENNTYFKSETIAIRSIYFWNYFSND